MLAIRTTIALGGLALALFSAGPIRAGEPERFEFRETHMGSEFRILLYCADGAEARQASRAAFDRVAELNRSFSDYDPESELMRLCDRAGGDPVPVSADLFDILRRSQAMADRSGGAFDVTIGPIGRLWRRARRDRKLPDEALRTAALAKVGHEKIVLDPERRTVRLLRDGMRLDLGGIAKGYAAQAALDVLRDRGISRALTAAAGDIVVGEPPPGETGWRVGIAPVENPGDRPPERFLTLKNQAVSTSGDAERFVEIDGVRYSHIVDPRTGLGVVGRAAATVVADDGATADSLATAVYLLGETAGLALADRVPHAAALYVRRTDEGETVRASARWKELAVSPADR